MLFLLKRRWFPALLGLAVLGLIGFALRAFQSGAPVELTPYALMLGLAALGIVLCSDGAVHGILLLVWGDEYRRRHRALAGVFQGQTLIAIVIGSLMAGVGEELVFRGASMSPIYLFGGAIVFGVLHHVRRDLWPFTVWAIWQGMLFALALYATQMLAVTMTAHFLHDFIGFLIFRYFNRMDSSGGSAH
jgi:membrane protease YdiL (CAAX protease family)